MPLIMHMAPKSMLCAISCKLVNDANDVVHFHHILQGAESCPSTPVNLQILDVSAYTPTHITLQS